MTTDNTLPAGDAPVPAGHHVVPHGIQEAGHSAYDKNEKNVASLGEHHHSHLHHASHNDAGLISKEKPLTGLSDPRIEKAPGVDKSSSGEALEERKKEEVHSLHVRMGHKKDDPPANYLVDKQGHIKELRSPDHKLNKGDDAVTIEVEPGTRLNKNQQAALDGLTSSVKKEYAGVKKTELTAEMQEAEDRTAAGPGIGTIAPKHRGGGVNAAEGPKAWGSHGGDRGGNGGRVPSAAEAHARGEHVPFSAPVDWSKMPHGLDRSKASDRIAALISSNEGSPSSINWNDNGAGVSVGMYQANQRKGELPKLFADFASTPDGYETLVEIFGAEMAAKMKANPEMIRGLNFSPNNQLGQELEQLVQKPNFQQLQLNELREKIQDASAVAKQHGITSEAGVALVADVINQFGSGGANGFLRAADGLNDQEEKARAVVRSVRNNSRYGDRYVADMQKMQGQLSFDREIDV